MPSMMDKLTASLGLNLPPMFDKNFGEPKIAWKHLAEINVDSLGSILACHLMVEHYITKFLEFNTPKYINWECSRLSYSQKLSLASGKGSALRRNGIAAAFKQLNAIRNNIGHNIEASITKKDVQLLEKCILSFAENKEKALILINISPTQTIKDFTFISCAFVAGICTAKVIQKKGKRKK